jgi:hypothetical protein
MEGAVMLEDHFRTLFNDFSNKKRMMYDALQKRDNTSYLESRELYEKAEIALLLFLEDHAEEILKKLESTNSVVDAKRRIK